MGLKPLGKAFIFAFTNETSGGKFTERNSGSIILTNISVDEQGKYARWAKVLAVGSEVTEFTTGDLVLIEALMWTNEFTFEKQKMWKSDESKVIAISEDESVVYAF